jgi:hypothetical protein
MRYVVEKSLVVVRTVSAKKPRRPCNLCGKSFAMDNKFMRFCYPCKRNNETYKEAGDATHYVVYPD